MRSYHMSLDFAEAGRVTVRIVDCRGRGLVTDRIWPLDLMRSLLADSTKLCLDR